VDPNVALKGTPVIEVCQGSDASAKNNPLKLYNIIIESNWENYFLNKYFFISLLKLTLLYVSRDFDTNFGEHLPPIFDEGVTHSLLETQNTILNTTRISKNIASFSMTTTTTSYNNIRTVTKV
jgi:hypothetical protein